MAWLTCAYLAAVIVLATEARAADPLRWKFEEGMSMQYQIEQTLDWKVSVLATSDESSAAPQSIGSKIDQTIDIDWRVRELIDKRQARVELTLRRIQVEVTAADGSTEQFDTAEDEPPRGATAMLAPLYRALTEAEISFLLSANGEMEDLQVSEDLLERIKNLPGDAAIDPRDLIEQLAQQLTLSLPKAAVEPQSTWRSQTPLALFTNASQQAFITYEIAEQEISGAEDSVVIKSSSAVEPTEDQATSLTLEGQITFDSVAGRLVSSTTDLVTSVTDETGEQESGKQVEKRLTQVTRVELMSVPAREPTEASIEQPAKALQAPGDSGGEAAE